jgi:hypothetical protein
MSHVEAFPLCWPAGFPRTNYRSYSKFDTEFVAARNGVFHELNLMRASSVILSTNVRLNSDGVPAGKNAEPKDPGVAVYFVRRGKPLVLPCDKWNRVRDNLQALRSSLEAMRGLERWGCSDILDRAFTGFTSLPAPEMPKPWFEILGVVPHADLDFIEDAYRRKMKLAHPDMGGSHEAAQRLNAAIEEARRAKGSA